MTEQPSPPFYDGPHLLCAVLCERVLEEKNGVKTAVRMVDRITRTVRRPAVPAEMEPFDYSITLLVRFKSGAARGGLPFLVRLIKPSGESGPSGKFNLNFEGDDDSGIDVVMPMKLRLDMTGLYWIEIILQSVRVTRVPVRVVYNPFTPQQRSEDGSPELPPPD